MGKYTTDPLRTGREIGKADELGTLGGEFGLCWNDTVPLTTGAHNAFLSAFFEASGVFEHLVDTCPLRLTSNNAPTNRRSPEGPRTATTRSASQSCGSSSA